MTLVRTVFAQLVDHLPYMAFYRQVARYQGDYRSRHFSCWDQLLCLLFAQLAYRESLRDIVHSLHGRRELLYAMGITGRVSRSTLADAGEKRDWRIYESFARKLIGEAQRLYAQEPFGENLREAAFALDSTTIDLCLSLFPWAEFRRSKAAIKLHTLLDLRGSIPTFVRITPGKVHDVRMLDQIPFEPGAIYVMDRGYLDFGRLYRIHTHGAFFVIRAKRRFAFQRRYSRPVDKAAGLRADQTVLWTGPRASYPAPLRRVVYYDTEKARRLVFLTNHFELEALTIAQLYKSRWQVELFFKWIKQNLWIKSFFGTSENAVKTQIWVAITAYVLVAIIRKRLGLTVSLSRMLQVFSVHLFSKVLVHELFANDNEKYNPLQSPNPQKSFKF